MALASCGHLFAQNENTQPKPQTLTMTQTENVSVLRQNISRPITSLQVKGKSAVQLFRDTTNYIQVTYNPIESDPINDNFIAIKGMTLTIDDPDGEAFYEVHLKKSELQFVTHDIQATIIYGNNDVPNTDVDTSNFTSGNMALQQQIDIAREQLANARKELRKVYSPNNSDQTDTSDVIYEFDESEFLDAPVEVITEPYDGTFNGDEYVIDDDEPVEIKKYRPSYSWEDRTKGAFLWGFNNWGSEWYNGLSKMDGAYNLKTSFSSWQLEAQYALIMTRHFNFSVGLGYESDIYKFSTPLIDIDNYGVFYDRMDVMPTHNYSDYLLNNNEFNGTSLDDWSTRLVTRYISMPITVGVRFNDFKIGLTALPALGINTSHTGLKHEIDEHGLEYQDVHDISKFIQPYKFDLRLDLRYDDFGFFIQTSTASLFTDGCPDAYPIKIGFIIKN